MTNNTYDRAQMTSELVRDEKLVPYIYDDATGLPILPGTRVVGHPTIGIGRNVGKGGNPLSLGEAYMLLGNDMETFESLLDASPMWNWWRDMDPIRQRALLNMAFNMGLNTLNQFVTFNRYLKASDWKNAGTSLQQSKWWGQVGQRAIRIQHMIITGTVPDGEPAPVTQLAEDAP